MSRDVPNDIGQLLQFVSRIYDYRINECGPVAGGVFWKDADSQILRLEILLKTIAAEDLSGPITVNDLGCGYGALFELMQGDPMMAMGRYIGYDISPDMVDAAKAKNPDPRTTFINSPIATEMADYSFVSGTYNMSMGAEHAMWTQYIMTSIETLWSKTTKALAFNMLDINASTKLDDLYYADRTTFLKHALTLSPEVEIIDDYPLDEFTIVIRRP